MGWGEPFKPSYDRVADQLRQEKERADELAAAVEAHRKADPSRLTLSESVALDTRVGDALAAHREARGT